MNQPGNTAGQLVGKHSAVYKPGNSDKTLGFQKKTVPIAFLPL